ncbi:MAG: hypothetical protein ACI81C_004103 [Alteromonas macleodii]|jgi:hypothetical protein
MTWLRDNNTHINKTVDQVASQADEVVILKKRRKAGDVKRHKKRVGYDNDTPKCQNCSSYIEKQAVINGSDIREWCKRNKFFVSRHGSCDIWESKEGDILGA